METGQIDGDILMYRICWSAKPDASMYEIKNHVNTYMKTLLDKVECTHYIGILGIHGSNNPKYIIFPDYKRGRPTDKPPHWNTVMNYLISSWRFVPISGCETDDALRLCHEQTSQGTSIIISSDKDMLQVPGKHFVMGITRKGEIVKEDKFITISKIEGERNFYKQMLTGDVVDNVKACPGIGPVKAEKLISQYDNPLNWRGVVIKEYMQSYGDEWEAKFAVNETLLRVHSNYAKESGFERPEPIPYREESFEY